jgi:hypothetical protein
MTSGPSSLISTKVYRLRSGMTPAYVFSLELDVMFKSVRIRRVVVVVHAALPGSVPVWTTFVATDPPKYKPSPLHHVVRCDNVFASYSVPIRWSFPR